MKQNFKQRISGKMAKVAVVTALAAGVVGLTAPMASASYESTWHHGCRGYWYSTSGHAYCDGSTSTSGIYQVWYDCDVETDGYGQEDLPVGYVGKWSTYECTFKINGTRVAG
ncbi:hypothetical protein QQY24_34295 [Streptomyces sp. TG1A-8]|uniref:hypothetical protein n=1 Tax=Streptomyces sp. TG1A-8 TaxID=3051385 RepID=UPI00265C0C97|nr:hypothetical protein [Streptomyces sp. TG1A-8]MDO0930132.1 hypothetical protein [Streptomyces sp. TG1A-8]